MYVYVYEDTWIFPVQCNDGNRPLGQKQIFVKVEMLGLEL